MTTIAHQRKEAVSKAAFYRRVAEAQRKYTLIINSLRLCVSAVIKKCTLLIQPLLYATEPLSLRTE
jgi:hypothetical protein